MWLKTEIPERPRDRRQVGAEKIQCVAYPPDFGTGGNGVLTVWALSSCSHTSMPGRTGARTASPGRAGSSVAKIQSTSDAVLRAARSAPGSRSSSPDEISEYISEAVGFTVETEGSGRFSVQPRKLIDRSTKDRK